MMTIEELKALRDSLMEYKRDYIDFLFRRKVSDGDLQRKAEFAQRRAEIERALKDLSEEDWKAIGSTEELATLMLYRREYADCEGEGANRPRFDDYKVVESRWRNFLASLSADAALAIWNHIAQHWFDWDCLEEEIGGYYLRRDFAGFSQLFQRIRDDVFTYGRARGMDLLDILCGVARVVDRDILIPDSSELTSLFVLAVEGRVPEAWVVNDLIERAVGGKRLHQERLNDECEEMRPKPWEDVLLPIAFRKWPELFVPLTAEEKLIRDKRRAEVLQKYVIPVNVVEDEDEEELAEPELVGGDLLE